MFLSASILALTGSLVAWQLWSESKKSFYLGHLSIALIAVLAWSIITGGLFDMRSLAGLSVNLLILSILSVIASKIRNYPIAHVPFLVGSIYVMFVLTGKTFQNSSVSLSAVDLQAELLVQVREKKLANFEAYAQKNQNIEVSRAFNPLKGESTQLDDWYTVNILDESPKKLRSTIDELSKREEVLYLEKNEVISIPTLLEDQSLRLTNKKYLYDDPLNNDQWALDKSNMNELYKMLQSKKPQHQASLFILDTGIDGSHEDLVDVYQSIKTKHDKDAKGHGTHCAGIAAAMTGNNVGIGSFNADASFTVSSIKVLADFGGGTQQGIIKGMIEAIDSGADVISMSLGGRSTDSRQRAYNQVVSYADKNNVIIVVAAGNSSANAKFYAPANSKGVITVAAVDENLQPASFTNTLQDIEMGVSAPGVNILSTFPGNKYQKFSGTSMATPFVAGLVTLMKSYNPELSTAQAFEILESTGIQTTSDLASTVKSIIDPSESLKKLLGK